MAETCVFCGAEAKLTREHLWPKWTRRLLDSSGDEGHIRETQRGVEAKWRRPLGSYFVPKFCAACNNGWMSRLEVAAKPILTPLITGEATALTPADCEVVARWATKTVLVADAAGDEPVLPEVLSREFYESREPPGATIVLLARSVSRRHPLFAGQRLTNFKIQVGKQAEQDWRGFLAGVCIGQMVLLLFGHAMANAIDLQPRGEKARYGRVVWPDPQVIGWPIPQALDDEGLRRFVSQV